MTFFVQTLVEKKTEVGKRGVSSFGKTGWG